MPRNKPKPARELHPSFDRVACRTAGGMEFVKVLPRVRVPVFARPGMSVQMTGRRSETGVITDVYRGSCFVQGEYGEVHQCSWDEVDLTDVRPDPAFLRDNVARRPAALTVRQLPGGDGDRDAARLELRALLRLAGAYGRIHHRVGVVADSALKATDLREELDVDPSSEIWKGTEAALDAVWVQIGRVVREGGLVLRWEEDVAKGGGRPHN